MSFRIMRASAWALLLALTTSVNAAAPTVTLDSGVFIGEQTQLPSNPKVVNVYKGIRFANEPERFAPAKPLPKSKAVNKVTSYPPTCIQQFNYPLGEYNFVQSLFNNPRIPESEDCLFLSVYAPANADGTQAVMVWLYPGAFQFGTGARSQWDGTSFAANQDVIIVAPNARTNVFGFPGKPPDVPAESRNVGLGDFRLSLDWVQENIAKFGGDPKKVTIFGESSGAVCADYFVTSEPDNPPFHAAILESGTSLISSASGFNWANLQPTIFMPPWPVLALSLGCIGTSQMVFDCIKRAPADKIKYICEHERLSFAQVVNDEIFVYPNSLERRRNRQIANVPLLLGSNGQEFRLFLAIALTGYAPSINLGEDLVQLAGNIASLIPNAATQAQITQAYPVGNLPFLTAFDALAELGTDVTFNCPAAVIANASAYAGYPTWRYLYNASFPNTLPFAPDAGAFHASEISMVFSNFQPGLAKTSPAPGPVQQDLTRFMQTAWANFAKDPYAGPGWDAYSASPNQTLGLLGGTPNPRGVANVPVSEFDQRCALFGPFDEVLGSLDLN